MCYHHQIFTWLFFITMRARLPTIRATEFNSNCEGMSSVIETFVLSYAPTGTKFLQTSFLITLFACLTILIISSRADYCLSDKIVFPFLIWIFVSLIKIYFLCQGDFGIFCRHIFVWMCCSNIQSKQTNMAFSLWNFKIKC